MKILLNIYKKDITGRTEIKSTISGLDPMIIGTQIVPFTKYNKWLWVIEIS